MRATLALNQLQLDQYLDRRRLPSRSPTAPLTPGNPRSRATAQKLPAYLLDASQPTRPDTHPDPGSPVPCNSPVQRRANRSSPGPASPCANRRSGKRVRTKLNSAATGDENRPLNLIASAQTEQSAVHADDMLAATLPHSASPLTCDSDLLFADRHVQAAPRENGDSPPEQLLLSEQSAGLGALQHKRGDGETAPEPLIPVESLSKEKAEVCESNQKSTQDQAAGPAALHNEHCITQSFPLHSMDTDQDCQAAPPTRSSLEKGAEKATSTSPRGSPGAHPSGPGGSNEIPDGHLDRTSCPAEGVETLLPPGTRPDFAAEPDSTDGGIVELRNSSAASLCPLPSQSLGSPPVPSSQHDVRVSPSPFFGALHIGFAACLL